MTNELEGKISSYTSEELQYYKVYLESVLESFKFRSISSIVIFYAQDLIYKDGMIGVNFAVLNLKYGRNQQYVLHMKDIEQFLRLERGF